MNPAIDLTLYISELTPGGTHRPNRSQRDVGGKAVNTVSALRNLGVPCRLLGFDFLENGNLLKEQLQASGIPYELLPTEGAIRTNVKIFEESRQLMTEFNQGGAAVSDEAVADLIDLAAGAEGSVLVLSGSLPPGADDGVYGEIIRRAKVPVILDTYGTALRKGLEAGAFLIKPNLHELELTFGKGYRAQDLLRDYPKLRAICLSLGADGAQIIGRDGEYFSPALPLEVRGVQGAGDAMVAGLAALLSEDANTPLPLLLKHAVAAAAASLIREGTLMADKSDFDEMLDKVEVQMLKSNGLCIE